jgi:hypothetical protein
MTSTTRSKPFALESAPSSSRSSAMCSNSAGVARSVLPATVTCQPSAASECAIAAPTLPVPPRMKARLAIGV